MRRPATLPITCKHEQPLHVEELPVLLGCLCCGRPKRDGTPYLVAPRLCISCALKE
jgi:hypothetical protein